MSIVPAVTNLVVIPRSDGMEQRMFREGFDAVSWCGSGWQGCGAPSGPTNADDLRGGNSIVDKYYLHDRRGRDVSLH